VRNVLAPPRAAGYTVPIVREDRPVPGVPTPAAPGLRRTARAFAALAAVAAALATSPIAAQPRERVDSTLPQPAARGERVIGTAAQREAGEARFRESLQRQAEIDALFNPHRAAWGGVAMPIYPTVVPPFGVATPHGPMPPVVLPAPGAKVPLPCPPGACPPPKPSPASAYRFDPQPIPPGVPVHPYR
jgi:hypothetical protein